VSQSDTRTLPVPFTRAWSERYDRVNEPSFPGESSFPDDWTTGQIQRSTASLRRLVRVKGWGEVCIPTLPRREWIPPKYPTSPTSLGETPMPVSIGSLSIAELVELHMERDSNLGIPSYLPSHADRAPKRAKVRRSIVERWEYVWGGDNDSDTWSRAKMRPVLSKAAVQVHLPVKPPRVLIITKRIRRIIRADWQRTLLNNGSELANRVSRLMREDEWRSAPNTHPEKMDRKDRRARRRAHALADRRRNYSPAKVDSFPTAPSRIYPIKDEEIRERLQTILSSPIPEEARPKSNACEWVEVARATAKNTLTAGVVGGRRVKGTDGVTRTIGAVRLLDMNADQAEEYAQDVAQDTMVKLWKVATFLPGQQTKTRRPTGDKRRTCKRDKDTLRASWFKYVCERGTVSWVRAVTKGLVMNQFASTRPVREVTTYQTADGETISALEAANEQAEWIPQNDRVWYEDLTWFLAKLTDTEREYVHWTQAGHSQESFRREWGMSLHTFNRMRDALAEKFLLIWGEHKEELESKRMATDTGEAVNFRDLQRNKPSREERENRAEKNDRLLGELDAIRAKQLRETEQARLRNKAMRDRKKAAKMEALLGPDGWEREILQAKQQASN
jgi:hypothetical protein